MKFTEMSSSGGKENARSARNLRRAYDRSVRLWCAYYGIEIPEVGLIPQGIYERYEAESMKDCAWLCQ